MIGNPPYQDDSDLNSRKPPVYNKFMDTAYSIAEKVLLITPARFLFNAGQTPKEWNAKMLKDCHFKVFDYIPDGQIAFPGTDIKGGVAIHYRDVNINYEPVEIFSSFPELNKILKKVSNSVDFTPLSSIMVGAVPYKYSPQMEKEVQNSKKLAGKSYDVRTNALDNLYSVVYFDTPNSTSDYVGMFGLHNKKRNTLYINRKYLICPSNFENYKVVVPKSNGTGNLGEVLSTPLVLGPRVGHTQSFISIGSFENNSDANNALKYIKTRFARTMLGILKITQDNPPEKWKYVPLQDFTSNSDIDWSKSIPEIDQQLYRKYGLSREEIDFIETHVKEMD